MGRWRRSDGRPSRRAAARATSANGISGASAINAETARRSSPGGRARSSRSHSRRPDRLTRGSRATSRRRSRQPGSPRCRRAGPDRLRHLVRSVPDPVFQLAVTPEPVRQLRRPVDDVPVALGERSRPRPPAQRLVVDVAGEHLDDLRPARGSRIEARCTLRQGGEDDIDAELLEPTVERLRVVVVVLREGELRRTCLADPRRPSPARLEPVDPPQPEERRVQDDRVRPERAQPARRASGGVVGESRGCVRGGTAAPAGAARGRRGPCSDRAPVQQEEAAFRR